jgi:hypothetical protein
MKITFTLGCVLLLVITGCKRETQSAPPRLIAAVSTNGQIQVASTTRSSKSMAFKMDVFTREGQTNLVCDTRIKDGALLARLQTFYHDGFKVGVFVENPNFQEFEVEPASPYYVRLRLHSPHDSGLIYIIAKDGRIVDKFTCTNGVYYPSSEKSYMFGTIQPTPTQ